MADNDSTRWYDGWLYASVFDPFETEKRRTIGGFIRPDSTVIDIACGTGALAFYLARSCRHVTGLELSSAMHRFTEFKKQKLGVRNVDFIFADASRLSEIIDRRYDCAVISLGLHEMPEDLRFEVVRQMKKTADSVILSDYHAPQPMTGRGMLNHALELIFGRLDGYRMFRSFMRHHGIDGLAAACGLTLSAASFDRTGTYKTILTIPGETSV